MRIEFVTYRWGADLVGGAELAQRRLALELRDAGCEVSVLTTTGHEFRMLRHWGNRWTGFRPEGEESDEGIRVRRLPMRRIPDALLALDARRLQAAMEREEESLEPARAAAFAPPDAPGVFLLHGWNHPEPLGGSGIARWSRSRSHFVVRPRSGGPGRIFAAGHAPRAQPVAIAGPQGARAEMEASGDFQLDLRVEDVGDGLFAFEAPKAMRPWRDFRELGVIVYALAWIPDDGTPPLEADFWCDLRALGRRRLEPWQDLLVERAMGRPESLDRQFDRLRGPVSPVLERAVRRSTADVVIHCNLPWATVSLARPGDLVLPFWHVEDDFYYWRQYLEAMRRARFVLAATPYAAGEFYPRLGIRAAFVGPPVWEAAQKADEDAGRRFRREHGIGADEILVLTVCRKDASKRYDAIAASVARRRAAGDAIRFIGIGPDADARPFDWDGCEWAGRLADEEVRAAYEACDVFVLMSESESFGIVIPEAWSSAKPVVVNRLCRTAASLVDDGKDGLLAEPGGELDGALAALARDPDRRSSMGARGCEKAARLFSRGAAARRLLEALEGAKG